jgi:hypothetical protein
MTTIADAICCRIAEIGKFMPAITHGLQSREITRVELAWPVSWTVVTSVHCLQQIERFTAANLADDDSVGRIRTRSDQIADGDLSLPLQVRRPRLERQHMLLLELDSAASSMVTMRYRGECTRRAR